MTPIQIAAGCLAAAAIAAAARRACRDLPWADIHRIASRLPASRRHVALHRAEALRDRGVRLTLWRVRRLVAEVTALWHAGVGLEAAIDVGLPEARLDRLLNSGEPEAYEAEILPSWSGGISSGGSWSPTPTCPGRPAARRGHGRSSTCSMR